MKRLPAFALALLLSAQAHALPAADIVDRMSAEESGAYISGALDMLAYELSRGGAGEKAACLHDWYYRSDGAGPREVVAVFEHHKDLPAVGILRILVDRHCN